MNSQAVSIPSEPYFIVGTGQEANGIRQAFSAGVANVIISSDYDTDDLDLMGNPSTAGVAIVLTNDNAAGQWADLFEVNGYAYTVIYAGRYRNLADNLQTKEAEDFLNSAYAEVKERQDGMRAEAVDTMLERHAIFDTTDVTMDLYSLEYERTALPTGIKGLDAAIGGLPVGALTVLGAGSSSGKTTLMVQIADHLAAAGHPVLFVSIEQGRHEIVAKSISRLMRTGEGKVQASTEHLQSRKYRNRWSLDKNQAMLKACTEYSRTIAPMMRVMQTKRQPTVYQVRQAAEAMRRAYGASPITIVDYLQLLKTPDERMSDRRATDINVSDLRMMAKELETSVVVISSINRASYNEGAGLESYKESGGIEFSADLALMLQPRDYNTRIKGRNDTERKENARQAMTEYKTDVRRKAELVVLKNRGGALPARPIPLLYDAMCNLFEYDERADAPKPKKRVL